MRGRGEQKLTLSFLFGHWDGCHRYVRKTLKQFLLGKEELFQNGTQLSLNVHTHSLECKYVAAHMQNTAILIFILTRLH